MFSWALLMSFIGAPGSQQFLMQVKIPQWRIQRLPSSGVFEGSRLFGGITQALLQDISAMNRSLVKTII